MTDLGFESSTSMEDLFETLDALIQPDYATVETAFDSFLQFHTLPANLKGTSIADLSDNDILLKRVCAAIVFYLHFRSPRDYEKQDFAQAVEWDEARYYDKDFLKIINAGDKTNAYDLHIAFSFSNGLDEFHLPGLINLRSANGYKNIFKTVKSTIQKAMRGYKNQNDIKNQKLVAEITGIEMTLEKVDVGGCLPGNAHGKRHGELLLGTHTVPFIHLSAKNNDCLLAAMDQTRKEHDGDQSNDRGARRN